MNQSIRKMVRHASRASRLLDALMVGGDLGTEASQAVIIEKRMTERLAVYLERVLQAPAKVVPNIQSVPDNEAAIILVGRTLKAPFTLSVQKTSPEAFALETGRAENHSVVVAAGNTERGLKRAVQRLILASEQAERGLTIPELHLTESAWIPQREWTLCHDPGALTQHADVFDYMRLLRGKFQAKNPKVDFAVDLWAAGSDSEYMQQLADNGFGDRFFWR